MVVLITGASGGLGQVLGRRLVQAGFRVYGTARNPAANDTFTMLPMEVNSDESVQRCIDTVMDREGRIDVLINCVNQMIIGSIEEQSVDEVQALYNANIFGVLRVCKAVIPIMKKQQKGTIVNMSSLGGILAVPMMSAYTSAKFCLEAMSEAMYYEMKPHGIDVVIMQPVAMFMDRPATGGHLNAVKNVAVGSRTHKMIARMAADTAASKLTPEMVSEKILKVISNDKKPLRVPMDKAKVLSFVKRLLPEAWMHKLVMRLMSDVIA